jgi:NitT/TauT family transport system substrate-binding protein
MIRILNRLVLATLVLSTPAVMSRCLAAEPFRVIVTDLVTPLVPNSIMELAGPLGYFEREGIDVDLIRVQQTPSAVAALRAGEGDMADIGVEAALQLVARGQLAIRAVMSPSVSLPYLIAAKAGIASIADLRGHVFGVGRVGSLDYSLSTAVLRSKGLRKGDIAFVGIGQPSVRARALAAGRIDATAISIGTWTSLADKSGLHVLVSSDAYRRAAPVVSKVNVVTEETLRTRRRQIAAVVRALIREARDFAREPGLWVAAMKKARPDIDPRVLTRLAESYRESWSADGGLDRNDLRYTADWMYDGPDFKNVRRIRLSDWVDFSLVTDALAALRSPPGPTTTAR